MDNLDKILKEVERPKRELQFSSFINETALKTGLPLGMQYHEIGMN